MFKKLCTAVLCIGLAVMLVFGTSTALLRQTASEGGGYVSVTPFEFNSLDQGED